MSAQDLSSAWHMTGERARQGRMLAWLVVSVLTALVTYLAFRGYLSPELLFQFGNALHC